MAPAKRRPCTICGKLHGCHSDECFHCRRIRVSAENICYCVICDGAMPRGRSHSRYCSLECARAVADARSGISNAIARLIRSGAIQPARSFRCVDCGGLAREYEHRQYLKPFDVVPVCHACNLKRGPAIDVKLFVANHFGVLVSDVHALISSKRKESEAQRARWLRQFTPKISAATTA